MQKPAFTRLAKREKRLYFASLVVLVLALLTPIVRSVLSAPPWVDLAAIGGAIVGTAVLLMVLFKARSG